MTRDDLAALGELTAAAAREASEAIEALCQASSIMQ